MALRKTFSTLSPIATSFLHDLQALTSLSKFYNSNPTATSTLATVVQEILAANRVLVTGIGKSGYVARRMAASLASVGVPSHFVHGTEWVHGDLGVACTGDIVVGFSHSGNTEELAVLPQFLKPRGIPLAVVIGDSDSTLGRLADHVVLAPATNELIEKVPSRSIVVQEAVVNAIVAQVIDRTSVTTDDFLVNHPGGSIGRSGV